MSGQQRADAEMGSGSRGASGSPGGGGAPHRLKFGKKVYFEGLEGGGSCGGEAGGGSSSGVPASSSGMPTSALAPMPPAAATPGPAATAVAPRRGKGVVQGGQAPPPPRCQVEGCRVDLTGAKAYYCRHKVCGMHSKAPTVVVGGLEQRFCQQCSRFHQLAEFDQGKRSCRRRLAGHNERRRKPQPGSLPSRYGHLPPSFHEDNGRYRGFLMDFSHRRLTEAARDVWPTLRSDDRSRGASSRCQDGPYTSSGGIAASMTQSYMPGSAGGSIFSAPKLPPSSSFGVSSSGCALSLLSSEPKGATATTNQAPTLSGSNYEGSPLAQAGASPGFTRSTWCFHGTSGSTLEIPREVGLGPAAAQDDGHSSGELELALQGNKQCPGNQMH